MKTLKIIVKGKVQGVFFRAFVKGIADKTDLKGWVRNLGDGSVEIRAQGSAEQLQELIQKCYQGSPHSVVESLQKDFIETDEVFEGFAVKH